MLLTYVWRNNAFLIQMHDAFRRGTLLPTFHLLPAAPPMRVVVADIKLLKSLSLIITKHKLSHTNLALAKLRILLY